MKKTVSERLLATGGEFSTEEIARYLISHNSVPRESFLMKAEELKFLLTRIRELESQVAYHEP